MKIFEKVSSSDLRNKRISQKLFEKGGKITNETFFYNFQTSCKKGVNVVPDVFKYIIMIEFVMENGQSDNFARDCMQKFRIDRMSGYAALYTDCTNRELEEIIDEESAQEFIEFQ